jgi:hypothetical protein
MGKIGCRNNLTSAMAGYQDQTITWTCYAMARTFA